jgi:hypothetical protein
MRTDEDEVTVKASATMNSSVATGIDGQVLKTTDLVTAK